MDCIHSQIKPAVRIKINPINTNKLFKLLQVPKRPKYGNINTNSMSKIRKIRVIKKNCKEKLERLLALGLNPHSKGLIFSMSMLILADTTLANPNKITLTIKQTLIVKANINI